MWPNGHQVVKGLQLLQKSFIALCIATITHCVTVIQKFHWAAKKKTDLTPAFVHFTVAWTKTRLRSFFCSLSGRSSVGNSAASAELYPARCLTELASGGGTRRWDRALRTWSWKQQNSCHFRCCISPINYSDFFSHCNYINNLNWMRKLNYWSLLIKYY